MRGPSCSVVRAVISACSPLLVALLLLVPMTSATGQSLSAAGGTTETGDATWRAEGAPEVVRPGERVAVRLHAAVDEGWYMYSLDSPAGQPLSVALDSLPAGFEATGTRRQSPPTKKYDPNFEAEAFFHTGTAEVRAGIQVGEDVAPGTYTLGGSVRYMVCSDQMCMPPTTTPVSVRVEVEPGAPREAYATVDYGALVKPGAPSSADAAPGGTEAVGAASGGGWGGTGSLWGFLLLAAGAGVGAFFMPCIFPMVPLTVSYFAKDGGRGHSVRQAGVYGVTIVVAFTGLGALAAVLLGAAGAQSIAAHPWVNVGIGAVLVFFALSLLGLFELELPSGLANYLNRQSNERGGYAGAVFMGLTLTVVSFSCTAPFVGGLLAAAAQGTWLYPVLGMSVFSGVLALPFVGFALFPDALERLPSSGRWMNAIKVTLGFVELAAALKFFSNADLVWGGTVWLSRPLVIALTVVLLVMAGLYLLGMIRFAHEPASDTAPKGVGAGRVLAATLVLGLALYLTPGLLGARLGALDAYFPPRHATDVGVPAQSGGAGPTPVDRLDWHQNDVDAAMAEAQDTGAPVFVDFSGYTCTNCREMEANVFPEPVVAEHLREDFVLLRLYTDDADKGPALQRYQQDLVGTVALPSYAVVASDGTVVAQHSGMASPSAFDAFLEDGLTQSPAVE